MARYWRGWHKRGASIAGVIAVAQVAGCLPDNAIRQVFSEQVLNTLGIGVQGVTSLFFGLGDLILNTLTYQFLLNLAGS